MREREKETTQLSGGVYNALHNDGTRVRDRGRNMG
jgi:hypothetical protein